MDQILGWIATILFCIMVVPQILKTLHLQSVKDVSISMYIVYLIANILALIYAILIHQWPLIIKYILCGVTSIFYLWIYFDIKRKETHYDNFK